MEEQTHASKKKGWEILSIDHETVVEWNLPIVSAITALDLPDVTCISFVVHECMNYDTAKHPLLSEFQ
jgi:hypothetical protein